MVFLITLNKNRVFTNDGIILDNYRTGKKLVCKNELFFTLYRKKRMNPCGKNEPN